MLHPDNDNTHSFITNQRLATSAIHGEPLPERTPEERSAGRERIRLKQADEAKAVLKQKRRIAARQAIGDGWDGKADNDNINWPLAKALLAEGNGDLLKYAMAYRRIHEQAHSGAVLGGSSVRIGDGVALDRHIHIRADGSISYKHVRQRTAAEVDIPAKQYVPPYNDNEDETQRNSIKVPKPWAGDAPVNDKLDAQVKLVELRRRLGAIIEPFEMAVIDGKTLKEVGAASGVTSRDGQPAAGRAICHLGLFTVRDALGTVGRQDLVA